MQIPEERKLRHEPPIADAASPHPTIAEQASDLLARNANEFGYMVRCHHVRIRLERTEEQTFRVGTAKHLLIHVDWQLFHPITPFNASSRSRPSSAMFHETDGANHDAFCKKLGLDTANAWRHVEASA